MACATRCVVLPATCTVASPTFSMRAVPPGKSCRVPPFLRSAATRNASLAVAELGRRNTRGRGPTRGGAFSSAQHTANQNDQSVIETVMNLREPRQIVTAQRQLEGAGFVVRRPLPSGNLDMVDPFLLIDEMGPVEYGPGEAVGAPDHPHRGFETV